MTSVDRRKHPIITTTKTTLLHPESLFLFVMMYILITLDVFPMYPANTTQNHTTMISIDKDEDETVDVEFCEFRNSANSVVDYPQSFLNFPHKCNIYSRPLINFKQLMSLTSSSSSSHALDLLEFVIFLDLNRLFDASHSLI